MPYNYDLKNAGKGSSKKTYDLTQFTQKPEEPSAQITPIKSSRFAHSINLPKPKTGIFGDVMAGVAKSGIPSLISNVADKVGLDSVARIGRQNTQIYKDHEAKGLVGKGAEFVGEQLPMLPAWAIGEGAASVIGKGLSKLPIASKLAPKLPGIVRGGLSDATAYATTVAPLESVARGENFNQFLEREKTAPLVGAGGVAFRGALAGAGKAVGKVREIHNTPGWGSLMDTAPKVEPVSPQAWNDVVNAYKSPSLRDIKQQEYSKVFSNLNLKADVSPVRHTNLKQGIEQDLVKPPLSAEGRAQMQSELESVFGGPKEIKTYSFKTGEQRALDELNKGIEAVQNYLGHNDIYASYPPGTPKETIFADIRANTGVDLPKLTDELARAQQVRTKLTPEQKNIGKAAGVIPNLKFEKPPLSTPEIPTPEAPTLPQRLLPNPERLTWTNKDGLPPAPRLNGGTPIELPKLNPKGNKVMAAGVEMPEAAASLDVPIEQVSFPGQDIDLTKIKDIGNLKAYTSDVYRIFRDVFGKDAGDEILLPLDKAKEAHIDMQNDLLGRLKSEIVDKLGIKKGSKESALVQQFGERNLDPDALALFQEGKITPEQLGMLNLEKLQQLRPNDWQKIAEADKWFRNEYDTLIGQINESRRSIYPNAEANAAKIEGRIAEVKQSRDYSQAEKNAIVRQLENELEDVTRNKIIPKRNDYYRHFQEMTEGFKALKNIFDSPAQISTNLIGTSEFTKPKSKWTSIAQKRLGNDTEHDAVGGFLDYVPAAAYATHIDPQTAMFRGLERALKDATADTHNADTFIGFLDKYASHLAGKTNPVDRVFQDMVPGGRKTFAALNWLNSRIKANTVLGKASSALAQLANIPTGIAFSKQYAIPGMMRSIASIVKENPEMAQSAFIKERYGGAGSKMYRQFDESLLSKPKEMAVWLMETADKIGTTFIWNSAYTKGLAQGVANPIRYADMATRDLVAGRGIGEVPLLQQSKVFQLIAPFQLEVANLWHVQRDFVNAKDFGGLVALYFLNYGFNEMMKATRGSGVVFDPVGATVNAMSEKDVPTWQRAGRVAGEVAQNVPLGSTLVDMFYPEQGTATLPSRQKMFGKNDPTRYGSSVLVAKGLQDPLFKILPPFGGDQIKKTLDGLNDLGQKAHLSGGKLAYPVAPTLPNQIKGTLFGPSAFSEAQDYYNNNRKPLADKQTNDVMKSPNMTKAYQDALTQREIDSISAKIGDIKKDKALTKAQQNAKIRVLELQQAALKRKLGR